MNGLDTPDSTVNHAHSIAAEGIGFVIRYLSPNTNNFPNKRLVAAEVTGLHSVNLKIGSVWETGNDPSIFTSDTGSSHATDATSVALNLGQPSGSAIYFAVDLDVDQDTLDNGVTDYFTAIKPILDSDGYRVGVYGSGQVCQHLVNAGLVDYKWLSQSTGWSQSSTYTDWDIKQGPGATIAGLDCDTDESSGEAGLW